MIVFLKFLLVTKSMSDNIYPRVTSRNYCIVFVAKETVFTFQK
jgi:hypothetical protein